MEKGHYHGLVNPSPGRNSREWSWTPPWLPGDVMEHTQDTVILREPGTHTSGTIWHLSACHPTGLRPSYAPNPLHLPKGRQLGLVLERGLQLPGFEGVSLPYEPGGGRQGGHPRLLQTDLTVLPHTFLPCRGLTRITHLSASPCPRQSTHSPSPGCGERPPAAERGPTWRGAVNTSGSWCFVGVSAFCPLPEL